jgi:hypothetical protein
MSCGNKKHSPHLRQASTRFWDRNIVDPDLALVVRGYAFLALRVEKRVCDWSPARLILLGKNPLQKDRDLGLEGQANNQRPLFHRELMKFFHGQAAGSDETT